MANGLDEPAPRVEEKIRVMAQSCGSSEKAIGILVTRVIEVSIDKE